MRVLVPSSGGFQENLKNIEKVLFFVSNMNENINIVLLRLDQRGGNIDFDH